MKYSCEIREFNSYAWMPIGAILYRYGGAELKNVYRKSVKQARKMSADMMEKMFICIRKDSNVIYQGIVDVVPHY